VKINDQEVDRRIARFSEVCRNAGKKLTHQRMEIFREVARTGDHPDAETVFQGVRERMPTVSLDTVYRTLWWLRDLGLVNTLGPPRERTRFDANLKDHHHFVCIRCGMTRDFYTDKLDQLDIPETVQSIGYAEKTQIEVKGVCRGCAGEENSQPERKGEPK